MIIFYICGMPPRSLRHRPKNLNHIPSTLVVDRQSPDVLFLNDILKEVKELRRDQKEILTYLKELSK